MDSLLSASTSKGYKIRFIISNGTKGVRNNHKKGRIVLYLSTILPDKTSIFVIYDTFEWPQHFENTTNGPSTQEGLKIV